jgi:hypothetical protein
VKSGGKRIITVDPLGRDFLAFAKEGREIEIKEDGKGSFSLEPRDPPFFDPFNPLAPYRHISCNPIVAER